MSLRNKLKVSVCLILVSMCVSFDKMDLKSFLFYFGLIVEINSRCTYSLGKNPWWKKDVEPPIEQVQTGILKR